METAKIDFLTFCEISSRFMTEEDEEGLKEELKEAFRIYDRDGEGFITTDVLKEILREIDSELTEDDLDNIIEEVDEDGSGTLDFDGTVLFISNYILNLVLAALNNVGKRQFCFLKEI